MSDLPAFDEVHVVSDLHMGGRAGFQILRETQRLANFILRLSRQRPDGTLALVLNGDVFDTLAEDTIGYVAVDDAGTIVQRIMDDPAFAPVWLALAAFVKIEGRRLVFVIGNHDIEIALPPVQRLLLSRLAGTDALARSRIEFSTAGAGYTCTVGGARVFCIHGNEVDAWNYNRYEDLAKLSRRMNAGLSLTQDEWHANAGTRMVKDVMNSVKRTYAWIDLLKPETSAAVGALLVLDPSQATRISQLLGVIGERRTGGAEVEARLSADGFLPADAATKPAPTLAQVLGPNMRSTLHGASDDDDMLLTAERHLARPNVPAVATERTLGVPQLIWDRLTGVSKAESLRRALLDWLQTDKSFDPSDPDDTFRQVTAAVGPAIDFIVTGHTHLERAIDMGQGRSYFNCGTWIRLLRFTPEMLADEASFKPVFDVLSDGRMKAIDAAIFGDQPFVLNQTSAVSIVATGGEVSGSLVHVVGDGSVEPSVVQSFTRR